MLLQTFPDINLVRRLKSSAAGGSNAWRNVVLNFECREASRLNLESPYSLFINKKGHSHCSVNGTPYRVENDSFLFTQPGDIYGLTIDNIEKTEICNVHITKQFFEEVAYSAISDDASLLDSPDGQTTEIKLRSQFYPKDRALKVITDRLTQQEVYTNNMFEATLADVVYVMIAHNRDVAKTISAMPYARPAVREDIYRRLTIAKDYLRSHYHRCLDLNEVCREVAMSKFHFLRSFKTHFGVSPYTYLANVRMEKATQLLKTSQLPIYEVSYLLGFEHPNSFIKAFNKSHGISPLKFRAKEISNFG